MVSRRAAAAIVAGLLAAASAAHAMILAVGDVTDTEARVLYECDTRERDPRPCPRDVRVAVYAAPAPGAETRVPALDRNISVSSRAQVLMLTGLRPYTRYTVRFTGTSGIDGDSQAAAVDSVRFHTFGGAAGALEAAANPATDGDDFRFAITSCNRYLEDGDATVLRQLADAALAPAPGRALLLPLSGGMHLGDQIYADILKAQYRDRLQALWAQPQHGTGSAEESRLYRDILNAFRALYRTTWGEEQFQRVLRAGAHWMIPDDHDLFDNADAYHRDTAFALFTRAGRRAFYEYQGQLRTDLAPAAYPAHTNDETPAQMDALETQAAATGSDAQRAAAQRVLNDELYFVRRLTPQTALIFLDTRFGRVFQAVDRVNPQYGAAQLQWLSRTLDALGRDTRVRRIFVFQSIPWAFINSAASFVSYAVVKERYTAHADLQPETLRVLELFKPHAAKLQLFAGDIHQFVRTRICPRDGGACLRQTCSSGVSRNTAALAQDDVYGFFLLNACTPRNFGADWQMHDSDAWLDSNAVLLHVNDAAPSPDGDGVTVEPVLRAEETRTTRSRVLMALYAWPAFVAVLSVLLGIPLAVIVCVVGRLVHCCTASRRRDKLHSN